MYQNIYFFVLNKKIHTERNEKQKKLKRIVKQKEPKEEKEKGNVAAVNNFCGKSNGIK